MTIPVLRCIKPGLYASIQDEGRTGYRRFGVPVSGAMDQHAYNLGNSLLHNPKRSAAIEIFFGGTSFEIAQDCRFTITGADLRPELEGQKIQMWKTFKAYKGQTLQFHQAVKGIIAYLHIEGGFISEKFMGSSSVYPRGALGQPLKESQLLYGQSIKKRSYETSLMKEHIPTYEGEIVVRVWPSRHLSVFTKEAITRFWNSSYRLKTGDRMAYLFQGEKLAFKNRGDIVSETTQPGTIQVPSSGEPIILMADAQTVGGYATIGKVFDEDLWKIVQLKKNQSIQFRLFE